MIYCNIKKKLKFVFVHLYIVLFQLYTVSSRLLLLEITGASRLQYMYVHTCFYTLTCYLMMRKEVKVAS